MISFSEIETTVKRATKSMGFSWGIAEEVGKNTRLLEMFGLPGIKNIKVSSLSIKIFFIAGSNNQAIADVLVATIIENNPARNIFFRNFFE